MKGKRVAISLMLGEYSCLWTLPLSFRGEGFPRIISQQRRIFLDMGEWMMT